MYNFVREFELSITAYKWGGGGEALLTVVKIKFILIQARRKLITDLTL